jgi:GT2 family glycosyltransferase
LLNNDTTVEPDFLNHLFEFMDAHPNVGAVQPRIFFEHQKDLLWNGGKWLFRHFWAYSCIWI